MRSKKLFNGKIEIYEDGSVYKVDDKGIRSDAKMTMINRRGNEYLTTSVTIDGKQKRFYPRRVIAEAFVPNPKGYKYVEQIDGNPYNLSVTNIRWMSNEDMNKKMNETRSKNSHPCKKCGELIHDNRSDCAKCKLEDLLKKESELRRKVRLEKERKKYEHVDINSLPEDYLDILEKKLSGMTLEEISEGYGVTRERIRQKLLYIKNGTIPKSKESKTIEKLKQTINQLEKELEKYAQK